jgi:hypothetical protein
VVYLRHARTVTSKHASNNRITDWINAILGDSSVNAWIAQQSVRVTWPLRFLSDITHPQRVTSATVEKAAFSACLATGARGRGRWRHTPTVLAGSHVTWPLCDIPDTIIELGFLCVVHVCPSAIKWTEFLITRVEAGSNTSTVTLRVVGADEKGSLKSESVKYGREIQGTRTRERLPGEGEQYIQKTDPSSRQRGRPTKPRPQLSNSNKYMGLDAKTYWLTDRQSQCDFDFDLSSF